MREIEKPLEALGIRFMASGHEYCGEHLYTYNCYQPHWYFEYKGHEFNINQCFIQDKWVVWVGDTHHLVDTMDAAVALVAGVEPRTEEVTI